jgi:predicted nucleic acid-binding protein
MTSWRRATLAAGRDRVADASVVVAYLLDEATEAERRATIRDARAPALLGVGATQTLRGGKIDLATAELARTDLGLLVARRYPDAPLLRRCWELRDVCTTYDALYVALAEALDAKLVTRDVRLARQVAGVVDVLAR